MKIEWSRQLQRQLALFGSLIACLAIFLAVFFFFFNPPTSPEKEIQFIPQKQVKKEDLLSKSSEDHSLILALQSKNENQKIELEALTKELAHLRTTLQANEKKLFAYREDNTQKKLLTLQSTLEKKEILFNDITLSYQTLQEKFISLQKELQDFQEKNEYLTQTNDLDKHTLQQTYVQTKQELEQSINEKKHLKDQLVLEKQTLKQQAATHQTFTTKLQKEIELQQAHVSTLKKEKESIQKEGAQKIEELTNQITKKSETLKKEQEHIQALNERTKLLMKDKVELIKVLTGDKKDLQKQLSEIRQRELSLKEKTNTLKQEHQQTITQLKHTLVEREAQLKQLLIKDEEEATTISTFLKTIKELEHQIANNTLDKDKRQQKILTLQNLLKTKNQNINSVKEQLKKVQESSKKTLKELQTKTITLQTLLGENQNNRKLLEQTQELNATLKTELKNLSLHYKPQIHTLTQQNETLQQSNMQLQQTSTALKGEIKKYKQHNTTLHSQYTSLNTQLKEEKNKALFLQKQLIQLKETSSSTISQLEKQNTILESNLRNTTQQLALLKKIQASNDQLLRNNLLNQSNSQTESHTQAIAQLKEDLIDEIQEIKNKYPSWKEDDSKKTEKDAEQAYTEKNNSAYYSSKTPITRVHLVSDNETLQEIASRYYGEPTRWVEIYDANRSVISNKNHLKKGTALVIP